MSKSFARKQVLIIVVLEFLFTEMFHTRLYPAKDSSSPLQDTSAGDALEPSLYTRYKHVGITPIKWVPRVVLI